MSPTLFADRSTSETSDSAPVSSKEELPWYALQVQSRLAAIASATLHSKGFEAFLPVYSTKRRWSDRMKTVEVPLFPGYLFCRFNPAKRLPILTTPGMIAIVGAGRTPVAVDNEEIAAIRAIVQSGLSAQSYPYLTKGSKVHIEAGPLAGVEGILTSTDKGDRLVVSVNLLQRSVAVEIDRKWVRPVAASAIVRSDSQNKTNVSGSR